MWCRSLQQFCLLAMEKGFALQARLIGRASEVRTVDQPALIRLRQHHVGSNA